MELPQLQRLQNRADAKESAAVIQVPGKLNRTVAVGVGLDDGHHRCLNPGLDGFDVVPDGIQVND